MGETNFTEDFKRDAGGRAADFIHLSPADVPRIRGGRGPLRLVDAEAVIARSPTAGARRGRQVPGRMDGRRPRHGRPAPIATFRTPSNATPKAGRQASCAPAS